MAFTVTAEITDNVVVKDKQDGTWSIEIDVMNPQANTYTFYWDYTKDTTSNVTVTAYYQDVDVLTKEYPRYFKDLTTGTLILDKVAISDEGEGSFTEIVMRNENKVILIVEPDIAGGNDTFEVFIKTNPLLGVGNR